MKRSATICMLVLFCLPGLSFGQILSQINGLQMGDPLVEVQQKIGKQASTKTLIKPDQVSFPLASKSEQHLILTDLDLGETTLEEVALSFADSSLVLVEVRGEGLQNLVSQSEHDPMEAGPYHFYIADLMVVQPEAKALWLLSQEAAHANLFMWSNPHLTSSHEQETEWEVSVEVPPAIRFGESPAELAPDFEAICKLLIPQPLDSTSTDAQFQYNLMGVPFAGFPRKFEARFGDEKLHTVWILTAKAEEGRIRDALQAQYGKAAYVDDKWEVFQNGRISLRKDKPEILLLSEDRASQFLKDLTGE